MTRLSRFLGRKGAKLSALMLVMGCLGGVGVLSLAPTEAFAQQTCQPGQFTMTYPSGQVHTTGTYAMNAQGVCVLDGMTQHYYGSGQLQTVKHFNMGVPNGEQRHYHNNGQLLSKFYYQNGKLHGAVASFYPDGTKLNKGQYTNGKKTGLWRTFHSNGQKESEGNYTDGKATGSWTWWKADGTEYGD